MRDDCIVVTANEEEMVLEQFIQLDSISKHLILDMRDLDSVSEYCASKCIEAKAHLKRKSLSLVLVLSEQSIQELPEILSAAPTLLEAYDVVELEEMERDLGF